MEDIAKILAYEIKQEIAQRYFGFRTRIEGQIDNYRQELQIYSDMLPPKIESDLQRLQFLLFDKDLFHSFLQLANISEAFIDTCSLALPVKVNNALWRELFAGYKVEGLTRRGRHKNLVFKMYRSLYGNVSEYRRTFIRLVEEHQDICDEITHFYKNNDLSGILSFLRDIHDNDGGRAAILQSSTGLHISIDRDLQIQLPPPATSSMLPLKEIPEIVTIKAQLKNIIKTAYSYSNKPHLPQLPF